MKLVAANGSLAVAVPAGRTLVVGRSPACDVSIRDLTVSRHHGEIEAAPAGLRIRDLGSTNGTFINGSRISEGVAAPGSRVAFGKVTFQVTEERAKDLAAGGEEEAASRIRVVGQMRAQSSTDVSSLLAADAGPANPASSAGDTLGTGAGGRGAGGSQLRVRGDNPAERRVTALSLLLEVAKELSQQGEPARLFDKVARLALQALAVDRVDILTPGDGDEMVSRVSKMRPGVGVRDSHVPRAAARKAVLERAAVLVEEQRPGAVAAGSASDSAPGASPAGEGGHGGHGGDSRSGETGDAAAAMGDKAAPLPDGADDGDGDGAAARHPVLLGATTDAVQVSVDFDRAAPANFGSGSQTVRPPSAASLAAAENARGNAICAPLLGMQATVLGLLYVETAEARALGREELQFVTALAGIVAVSLENLWLMEQARSEALTKAGYQRHFGPFVAEQVAGQDGGTGPPAARRRVTFLSCELRGFTVLAERLAVEEVSRLLGEIFTETVDLVFEHSGTLSTLTGTGLTAFWGAPLSRPDDADEAVQAAIGMQRALERLNGDWSRQGRSQLALAIGIDLGEVFAGSVGSERRLEFTAIGRPVENAGRLCAAAGAGEILASEALLAALSNPPPVDALPPAQAAAAAGPSTPEPPGEAPRPLDSPAYRIDWRTPPTLRQSGELARI
jgi:class 3 adenylate cyclase